VFRRILPLFLFIAPLQAHLLNMTRVLVTFSETSRIEVTIEADLTQTLGSPEVYYSLSRQPPDKQKPALVQVLPRVLADLQFKTGETPLVLELQQFSVPQKSRAEFEDYYVGKMTKLVLFGTLPPQRLPFQIVCAPGAHIEFPLAITQVFPSRKFRSTRWIETPGEHTQPLDYDKAEANDTVSPVFIPIQESTYSHWQRVILVQGTALLRFLNLGFHHIIPKGTDHILFVLGLFFLGIGWRKLLSQTTVFTIAHGTTLFLSTKGIFTLPPWFVEPAIACSITFIAVENIFNPKLSVSRLLLVFAFGLIHGLGFASSLNEVPMPQHEYAVALLGFNFGVDFGQLFIIGCAFFLVGWWRHHSWFRSRITVPASCLIALIGAYWAVERILNYAHGS
jgi:hydrogenase/urease accessory protein HupE